MSEVAFRVMGKTTDNLSAPAFHVPSLQNLPAYIPIISTMAAFANKTALP